MLTGFVLIQLCAISLIEAATVTYPAYGCGMLELSNVSNPTPGTTICISVTSTLAANANTTGWSTLCNKNTFPVWRFPICNDAVVTYTPENTVIGGSTVSYDVWEGEGDGIWYKQASDYSGRGPTTTDSFSATSESSGATLSFLLGNTVQYWPSHGWTSGYTITQKFRINTDGVSEGGLVFGYNPTTGDHLRIVFKASSTNTFTILQKAGSMWYILSVSNLAINDQVVTYTLDSSMQNIQLTFASQSTLRVTLKQPLSSGSFGYLMSVGSGTFSAPTQIANFNRVTTRWMTSPSTAASRNKAWKTIADGANPLGPISYESAFNIDLATDTSYTILFGVAPLTSYLSVVLPCETGNIVFVLSHPNYSGRTLLQLQPNGTYSVLQSDTWKETLDVHSVRIVRMMFLFEIFVDDVLVFILPVDMFSVTKRTKQDSYDGKFTFVTNDSNNLRIANFTLQIGMSFPLYQSTYAAQQMQCLRVNATTRAGLSQAVASESYNVLSNGTIFKGVVVNDAPSSSSAKPFVALFCSGLQYSVIGFASYTGDVSSNYLTLPGVTLSLNTGFQPADQSDVLYHAIPEFVFAVDPSKLLRVVVQPSSITQGRDVYGSVLFGCAVDRVQRASMISMFDMTLYSVGLTTTLSMSRDYGSAYTFDNGTFVYADVHPTLPKGQYALECACKFPGYFTNNVFARLNSSVFTITSQTLVLGGVAVGTALTDMNLKLNPLTLYLSEFADGSFFNPNAITGDVLLNAMRGTLQRREHTPGAINYDSEFSGFNVLKALMVRDMKYYGKTNMTSSVCTTSTKQSATKQGLITDPDNAVPLCFSTCLNETSPTVGVFFTISADKYSCLCGGAEICKTGYTTYAVYLDLWKPGTTFQPTILAITIQPQITYRLESTERISIDVGSTWGPTSAPASLSFLVRPSCAYYAIDGSDFRGREGSAKNTMSCRTWNDTMLGSYRGEGLDDHMRYYCRNPNADPRGPWCNVWSGPSSTTPIACDVGDRCPNADFVPSRITCNTSTGAASTCASILLSNSAYQATSSLTISGGENAWVQYDLCAIFGVVQVRVRFQSGYTIPNRITLELRRNFNDTAPYIATVNLAQFGGRITQQLVSIYSQKATLPVNLPSYRLIRIRLAGNETDTLRIQSVDIVGSCIKVPTQFGDLPICECDDPIQPTSAATPSPPSTTDTPPSPPQTPPQTTTPAPTYNTSLPSVVVLSIIVEGTPQDIDLQHVQIRIALALSIDANQISVMIIAPGSVILKVSINSAQLGGVGLVTVDDVVRKLQTDAALVSDVGIESIQVYTTAAPSATPAVTATIPLNTTKPPGSTNSVTPSPSYVNGTLTPPSPTGTLLVALPEPADSGLAYWVWILVAVGALVLLICLCCGVRKGAKTQQAKKEKKRLAEQKKFYARAGDISNGLETQKEDFVRNPIQDIPAPGREV